MHVKLYLQNTCEKSIVYKVILVVKSAIEFFWVMSSLRNLHITMIQVETNCSDLVDMIEKPVDWSRLLLR